MSNTAKEKNITIGAETVTAKELTVSQIKKTLEAVSENKGGATSIIDLMFGDQLPGEVIEASCGITVEKLEESYTPSEINEIVEAVKAVNPFLLTMFAKLVKASKALDGMSQ